MIILNSFVIFVALFSTVKAQCTVPAIYTKTLFSIEDGKETSTLVKAVDLIMGNGYLYGTCEMIVQTDTKWENAVNDIQILYKNRTNGCYFCYHYFWRSNNVIQYRRTQCQQPSDILPTPTICESMVNMELETGFVQSREEYSDFNCKSIIEGVYSFTYRVQGSTGVCTSSNSFLTACQKQGSPLRDNTVYTQKFGYCPNFLALPVLQDVNNIYSRLVTWRCFGRWVDTQENIWAAIEYDTNDIKFKYRCMVTKLDQQNENNLQYWGMSVDANCKTMKTYFDAPLRLDLTPSFDPVSQLPQMDPGCKLPTNFTGNWFYPAEYSTSVVINSTHIYFNRRYDKFRYEEIFFVCRQSQESRYLMTAVTKGKCEVDFICFDFLPRHQNIIRFRLGRPFRLLDNDQRSYGPTYMVRMFREACHWNSFTLNYLDWVYEYFILDPPVPINCPIQGRYLFQMNGQQPEKYYTKIPGGVTPRPRVEILCDNKWQSDIAACTLEPKQMRLDADRCMRLDYTGRPISEYDVTDNFITCVGYWMEDTKSFLITYDPDDPVAHHFRCWVYRRLSFHNYVMSRAQSGHCAKLQTAESIDPNEGVSLRLELVENELEFDVCPMNYDDGHDPYANPTVLNVFSGQRRVGPMLGLVVVFALVGGLIGRRVAW